jgi:hypothetical protein
MMGTTHLCLSQVFLASFLFSELEKELPFAATGSGEQKRKTRVCVSFFVSVLTGGFLHPRIWYDDGRVQHASV